MSGVAAWSSHPHNAAGSDPAVGSRAAQAGSTRGRSRVAARRGLIFAAAAVVGVALLTGCARRAKEGEESATAAAPRQAARAVPQQRRAEAARARSNAAQTSKTQPARAVPKTRPGAASQPRVERLHTPEGIVTITYLGRATAQDFGLPSLPEAKEKESALWRMRPPQGEEWLLAIGEFSADAPLERLEQFYRKALGAAAAGAPQPREDERQEQKATRRPQRQPPLVQTEVRRSDEGGQTLIVLSRIVGPESIVVRITRPAGAKSATILIRRAVRGARVKLEPAGPPQKRKPRGTPV